MIKAPLIDDDDGKINQTFGEIKLSGDSRYLSDGGNHFYEDGKEPFASIISTNRRNQLSRMRDILIDDDFLTKNNGGKRIRKTL